MAYADCCQPIDDAARARLTALYDQARSGDRASFDLDPDCPTITVEAGYSKRRRQDTQPINSDLAARLRLWLPTKPTGRPVFEVPVRMAAVMRVDLETAGIPYEDDRGHVVDFHALRHTYITRVVNSGASVKVSQELARHSDPKLTIGRYAHVELRDLSRALEALPADTTSMADVRETRVG